MLTEKSDATPAPAPHHAPKPGALDDLICYFEGDWVAMRDAKVSIMTHAFMYGTATFEGIRAYWNADQGVLYGLKLREHVERLPPVLPDPDDGERPLGRRADPAHRRDGPAQRVPRGRLHPAVVLQVDLGDRRPAARPRQRAVRHRPAVRQLHRHRIRRQGHDLDAGGATPTRHCRPAARSSAATSTWPSRRPRPSSTASTRRSS